LALPLLSWLHMASLPHGETLQLAFFDATLTLARVDRLSLVFGTIFHLAALLGAIYALHNRSALESACSTLYAAAAIGAVFAGDLITLFVYWELTAVSSVFLIWARRTERADRAGMRYLIVQVGSGVLLLGGTALHYQATGSLAFDHFTLSGASGASGAGAFMIFIAFGIKCAFPFLHNWLQDAYPEATVTGTVMLSAFTTKLAVYALARGFAGTESLIWIGATMTAFPIFYAVIENDLRRVLSYSLNNQLGFMVVGIGIGTPMALNGTAAHAFCHILYKALLFMSMGAVLHRAGTVKGSELGGLSKSMPWTTLFCCVGAASISAFPFFSGFVSKSLITGAAAEGHLQITWLVLIFASAGVFHHSGIKIPFFAFFAHDSGIRCKEAPWNMLLAMGITAALCVGIGIWPGPLYRMLPFAVDYQPYTVPHVVTQWQLLFFSALAFTFLWRTGLYPKETPSVNLDSDWIYRRFLPAARGVAARGGHALASWLVGHGLDRLARLYAQIERHYGPAGVFARTWATGSAVFWVLALLCIFLFMYYL
jgi:multicomponent Na+:H+ antiporter subunit D